MRFSKLLIAPFFLIQTIGKRIVSSRRVLQIPYSINCEEYDTSEGLCYRLGGQKMTFSFSLSFSDVFKAGSVAL